MDKALIAVKQSSSPYKIPQTAEVQIIASNLSFWGHYECPLHYICFTVAFVFGGVHEVYSQPPPPFLSAAHQFFTSLASWWHFQPGGIGLAVMGGESGYFSRGRKGSLLDLTDFHTLPPLSCALSRAMVPNSDLTRAESFTTGLPDTHFFFFACVCARVIFQLLQSICPHRQKQSWRPTPETPVLGFNMRGFKQGERYLLWRDTCT